MIERRMLVLLTLFIQALGLYTVRTNDEYGQRGVQSADRLVSIARLHCPPDDQSGILPLEFESRYGIAEPEHKDVKNRLKEASSS
jgi:hypothetical protein